MVVDVTTDAANKEVVIQVERAPIAALDCPSCGKVCAGYDSRRRRWRHLDTCQYKTIVVADVPRINCPEHGVQQIPVPWAETNARFTGLFEAPAINWLRAASISAVGRLMDLSWHEVDGIMLRAVIRGFARRELTVPERMGVDETSFQKRHEYVTVVTDLDDSKVLYVADDRKAESLAAFYRQLTPAQKKQIFVVAMDMHQPYILATEEALPDAELKIAFDKFHVAKHLGDAIDKVRRQEHAALMAVSDWTLKGTKHVWLTNPANITDTVTQGMFEALKATNLRTARAWALKECAMGLWHFMRRSSARTAWKQWIAWARRCQLELMKKVASMVRSLLEGFVTAIVLRATNAASESINAKIQKVKRMACGFRNRERFRNAIYFHLGGLDLYPASAMATHTNG